MFQTNFENQGYTLPLYHHQWGDFGVTSATRVAEASFIASVLTKQLRADIIGKELPVPGYDDALLALAEKLPGKLHEKLTFTAISIGKLQRKLTRLLHVSTYEKLLQHADERDQARLREVSQQYAGAWLSVAPIKALNLVMEPRDYRTCLRVWLGLPVHEINPEYPVTCPACKSSLLDKWGDHSVICAKYCDRISKHDSVRDIVKCYLAHGALSSRIVKRETPGLIAGKKDKPADIFVSN